MALVGSSEAFVTFKDAAGRSSDWSVRIGSVPAQLYVEAADDTARNATGVGTLLTRAQVLSELTMINKGVRYAFTENAPTLPAGSSGKLRGNKVVFRFSGSGRNFVTSIPGRNESVMTLVDGTTVVVDDAGAVDLFRDAFNAVALDVSGGAATIQSAYIDD